MVATVRDPGDEALERDLAGLEDTVVEPEAGDGTEVLVEVLLRVLACLLYTSPSPRDS